MNFNFPMAQRQQPINPTQFQQFLPLLNDNVLRQLMAQARGQGISDQQIAEGMNLINSLRKAP